MEGYELPVHRSLTEPILFAGVPRNIAIINGAFAAALILQLHSWFSAPLFLIIHLLAAAATKTDPQFFDCFIRFIRQKTYYST